MEIWKDISGYKGYYQVSNYGNIKRVVSKNRPKERLRKILYKKNGYAVVMLSVKQKYRLCHIHRLVAIEFVENPDNKPQVNHIDLNKKNNSSSNLEWVTHAENMNHVNKIKKWSNNAKSGAQNSRSRPIIQYSKSGEKIKVWVSITEASVSLNIGNGEICLSCQGRRKSAGGFCWQYLHPHFS